ncbi:hypothetical protein [Embleya hyalina]|uniref:Uncharacterized protein n=1 Tax=Embleya hyalina TaxID=516124 RepID=A0A401YZ40_9ACTN|nr:hypothetical protein [Embleya hyalina]GCD99861.1 hypothetical protein EHYA_07583 [Embleya hyalina]
MANTPTKITFTAPTAGSDGTFVMSATVAADCAPGVYAITVSDGSVEVSAGTLTVTAKAGG